MTYLRGAFSAQFSLCRALGTFVLFPKDGSKANVSLARSMLRLSIFPPLLHGQSREAFTVLTHRELGRM